MILYYRFVRFIEKFYWINIKRKAKFFYQRRTRGWDDSDTWSLDYTIAKFVLPRLKRFKELNDGFPPDFTEETWDIALDDIIFAMECAINNSGSIYNLNPTEMKRWRRGNKLFGKYFNNLWW